MDRQALLQDKIDALGAWEIDTKLEIAMDATYSRCRYSNKELVWRERVVAWLCAVFYFNNLMFYYWMSLPWMQKAYCG
jgi:hypothetical protein